MADNLAVALFDVDTGEQLQTFVPIEDKRRSSISSIVDEIHTTIDDIMAELDFVRDVIQARIDAGED